MTSIVATIFAVIQAKHKDKTLSLYEMIKKSLLLRDSPSATPLPNPDATAKAPTPSNASSKVTERWNQSNLNYFDPYLDKTYKDRKIVLVGKDVYYKNVVLFVQQLQSLVTFKGAALLKTNIVTSLCGSVL